MEKASIKKQLWQDVRDKVAKVNSSLAAVIDSIDPGPNFPVYVARYPYGSVIVSNGMFQVPNSQGELVPINHQSVSDKIKEDFSYAELGIPAGIVLNRSMHELVTTASQSLPLGVVKPGSIFSLWQKLDSDPSFHPVKMFTITAGARFIFMLPNISDVGMHKNLKRDFKVLQPPPKNLLDQWDIFKTVIHHQQTECNWATELLFFSENWFEQIKDDRAWQPLYLHMLETVWRKSTYERNHIFYELAFSRAQANRNLKPNPYLADTAKHLFMIAAGVIPGFGAATDDACAPASLLQKAYIESYGLKYNPTIFIPKHFALSETTKPVYYSMVLPTTLEFSPKSRKLSTTMQDLSELRHVTYTLIDEIKMRRLNIENTAIEDIISKTQFEFFHSKPDRHDEINLTTDMIKSDLDLMHCSYDDKQREFAFSGTFIRGCVRLACITTFME